MPILSKKLRNPQETEKKDFLGKIITNTNSELVDTFDEEGTKILEKIGIGKDYIYLASKFMNKDIASIISVIEVMRLRDKKKALDRQQNSLIFSILQETILESALLYIGFSQKLVDLYLGDKTTVSHPINISNLVKLVKMKEEGTLTPFQELELLDFDNISKISNVSEVILNNLGESFEKINKFKKEYNVIVKIDDIVNPDLYPTKKELIFENGLSPTKDRLSSSDFFSKDIYKLIGKLSLLETLGFNLSFDTVHNLHMNNDENQIKNILKGVDNILSMKDQLLPLTKFGFKLEWSDIVKFNDEFISSQIDYIVSLLPKLEQLITYKGKKDLKIRISLEDILKCSSKLSEDILDKLLEKKEMFILFFYMINQKTISLNHIVELEYMITNENALSNYMKLEKAGVVIHNFQLPRLEHLFTEIDETTLANACRISEMGIRLNSEEIGNLLHMEQKDLQVIFDNEDNIKIWLGNNKSIKTKIGPVACDLNHNYTMVAFVSNSGVNTNLKWLSKICSISFFPEFAKKYESFQLGTLNITPEQIYKLLELYKSNSDELYILLGKIGKSEENTTIKQKFIDSLLDNSKAYYKLPETTQDEFFIAKQIISNSGLVTESISFIEDLGYDTSRNSGTYFACLRRLQDDNAWHKYEYAEYLYDIADIDGNGITDENWVELLGLYSISDIDEGMHQELKENLAKIIPPNNITHKNFILAKLRELLNKLLDSGLDSLSRAEKMIIDIIHTNGAGNLSYIEGISNFIYQLVQAFQAKSTVSKTKGELKLGIQNIDNILSKKGWDNADTIDFFNIGSDILESAPSLYTTYLDLFQELSPKQLKEFYKNMYPYYHIELVLHQGIKGNGDFYYKSKELVSLRKNIKTLISNLKKGGNTANILKKEQERIQNSIKEQFQSRFGIKKIPDIITSENMNSIKNHTLYLANIQGLDDKKETLIGFFLALKLNGVWNDFREGKNINIEEYMIEKKVSFLKDYMKERKKTGISLDIEENLETFYKSLQEEIVAQSVGDVDDIDVRLLSIQSNIMELLDEDIYKGEDKIILNLLNIFGKKVGKALAMKFRELEGKGELGDEDKLVVDTLGNELEINIWTVEIVKKLQKNLKSLSPITNFVQKVKKIGVDAEVDILKNAKIPSKEIIDIFHKLGENFSNESGIRAISNDVQYLRIIVAKGEDKITEEEKELVIQYLDNTEEHILNLERIKDRIETLFDNMYQQLRNTENSILKDRLAALKEIVYQSVGGKKVIITKMTTDLDTVITNIRACLSCQKKECNNDTNLSFGDNNRFFMTSYSGNMEKSFSDQLVTLLETNEGSMFVMDLMYGERVPDVFLAHILCICKKLKALKIIGDNEGNSRNISIFVPSSASRGCHLTEQNIKKSLEDQFGNEFVVSEEKQLEITIGESASGDAYHEFSGSNCRGIGKRNVRGLILSVL